LINKYESVHLQLHQPFNLTVHLSNLRLVYIKVKYLSREHMYPTTRSFKKEDFAEKRSALNELSWLGYF